MNLIIIKQRTVAENPINVYRVHVTSRHGESDFTKEKSKDFDENALDELYEVIRLVCDVMTPGYHIEDEKDRMLAVNLFWELFGFDMTKAQKPMTWANPESLRVTYFNSFGIEHEVVIELDDHTMVSHVAR